MGIKNKLLDVFKEYLTKYEENITEDELEVALYGMEVIYSLVTKLVLYFIISLVLNCHKEFLITMLILGVIKTTSFGFHAEKETSCYLLSFLIIFGTIYVSKYYTFKFIFIIIACLLSWITTILYAPADTEKRPLLNKHTRSILKLCSTITVIFFTFIALYNVGFVSSAIVCILIVNSINISPILYKIFKKRYRNYEYY